MDKCCGTCKWHQHDKETDDRVCRNDMSENYADWTGCNDRCIDW